MPIRSTKLKMVVPRGQEGSQLRRDLWTTHAEINRAAQEVERVLLLCRGAGYLNVEDERVDASDVRREALAYARKLQRERGGELGTDQEILDAMRLLYVSLVPSAEVDKDGRPGKGDAQQSRGYVGPLMNPDSMGMLDVFQKLVDPLPDWVTDMEKERPGWEKESEKWLASNVGQALLSATGRPPYGSREPMRESRGTKHSSRNNGSTREKPPAARWPSSD